MKNGKKRSMIFAIIMSLMLSMVGGIPEKVSAASQGDAVSWANSQIGKALDYDGVYGMQCIDLIKYYYAYFGYANYAMGNANAYITNALPPGWTRVYSGFQAGDIAVWKVNHSCSTCNTGGYGHVGIITSADSVGFNAVNQNFNNQSYCTQNWFYCSALACAIRPAFTSPVPAQANISFTDFSQNGVWDKNSEFYIKVLNPDKKKVSKVGCYLYNESGGLVKSYTEDCNLSTSYINYTCNINADMKFTLTPGTTYKFVLFAIVDGKEFKDTMRSFKTTGNSDQTKPVISEVSVYDITETGYKVRCKATDNVGVVRVQFPTWTTVNDQDDIQPEWWSNPKASGTLETSGYYVYEVKISDHNNEFGEYNTHIYAYDNAGNSTGYAAPKTVIEKKISNTPSPTIPSSDQNSNTADGNSLVSVAEQEYRTYHGQQYNYQYGTSPWCCNFVSWCARRAGISTDVIKSTATVQTMYDNLINACGATIVETPQKGDLVFYKYTDYDSERFHHIGIMTSQDESVQGNVNNTWWKGKPDALDHIKQMVYVRPAYDGKYVGYTSAYFSDYQLNSRSDTNAEVYIKIQNPNREGVTGVGCELYDENDVLLKSYSESCSYMTSFVNYTCNFNQDMGYTLASGTTYRFLLYAIVGGKRINDQIRTFTTTGSKKDNVEQGSSEDYSPTGDEENPALDVSPTPTVSPDASKEPAVSPTATPSPVVTQSPGASPSVSASPIAAPAVNPSSAPTNINPASTISSGTTGKTLKKPPKVTGVTLSSYSKKMFVSWNFDTSDNRTGYEVQYALNKSFTKGKKAKKVGYYKTSLTIKKLKKGKKYYVRVRGINRSGGSIKYGAWSKVKKVKIR